MQKITTLSLKGTRLEIGQAYGETAREKIKLCWEFYRSIIRANTDTIQQLSLNYEGWIRTRFPHLMLELEGIAKGSTLELWEIVALNSRTELIRTINTRLANECTLVYSPSHNIIAQTWDWAEALEDLLLVLDIELENDLRITTLTEAGILGKIGFNNCGLGIGLNILKAPLSLSGIPIHILLRASLEAKTRAEIDATLTDSVLGTTSAITFIFPDSEAFGVEIFGSEVREYPKTNGTLIHTNHYLSFEKPNSWEKGPDMESSLERFIRTKNLLAELREYSPDSLKKLLHNSEGSHPICHGYQPDDIIGSEGTVCRIIIDPNNKSLEVAKSTTGEYQVFKQ